jgi:magnesium transporter
MAKLSRRRVKPAGSSPGTVVYVGAHRDAPVKMNWARYTPADLKAGEVVEKQLVNLLNQSEGVLWINIDGVHDTGLLTSLGQVFKLHPLVVEDIANTVQRPKLEDFGEYIFVAMKMIVYERDSFSLKSEHVSLIVGRNYVLSFLEDEGDVFEPVRARLKHGRGQIRSHGPDYLLYALIDAVVDKYFEVLEDIGEDIERIEHSVVDHGGDVVLRDIYATKRQLISFRRAVWPLREAIHSLQRDDSVLIQPPTRLFLRDLYDHLVHVMDTVETSRDIVSGMLDVYLSSTNNKMNEIMKVLTIMSSIFIPLTFIVGIYGMNFEHMPELKSPWGYPGVLLGMTSIAVVLLALFKRKGWI